MRTIIMLLFLVLAASAHAAKGASCVYKSADLGTLVGRGPSFSLAFEDAATQCFERRTHLSRARHPGSTDEDASLAIIDVCANLRCS